MNSNIVTTNPREIKEKIIYTIIFTLLALLAILGGYLGANFNFLDDSNSVLIDNKNFSPNLSARRISHDEVGLHQYSYFFSEDLLDSIKDSEYKIIINKLTDNAVRIRLNGQIICSEGNFTNGNSMLKNSFIYGTIDNSLIQPTNILTIETYALYKTGTESNNVMLTQYLTGMKSIKLLDFVNNKLVLLGLGFLFFSALFTLYIYLTSAKRDISLIYCSIATLSLSIYFFDYIKIIDLSHSYFIYKKIFLFGLATGITFYVFAIKSFIKSKLLSISTIILFFSYIAIMLVSKDLIQFKVLYEYWYFLLIFNIILFLIYFILIAKRSMRAYIFLISFILLGIYTSYAIIIEFRGDYFIINSPLLYMTILATLPLLIGFDAINEKDRQIIREQELKEEAFLASLIDNLTGAWNQRYLDLKFSEDGFHSTLAILDFDNFKYINDTYGHLAGDYLLKEVSKIILKTIRNSDELCRYGGDEFVILFNNCSDNDAHTIIEKIRKLINQKTFHYDHQSFQITLSIGLCSNATKNNAQTLLKQADTALYKAKQSGKNTVVIYNSNEINQ